MNKKGKYDLENVFRFNKKFRERRMEMIFLAATFIAALVCSVWNTAKIVTARESFGGFLKRETLKAYVIRMNLAIIVISLVFILLFYLVFKIYDAGRKELTEKVFFDEVTGGINGRAFRMKYRQIMPEIQPFTYTVILLDAQNFKLINEKFGEESGDRLLHDSYQTILKHIKEEDNEFAARSELDHFFICMKEGKQETIQKRIDEIIRDINEAWGNKAANHPVTFWQAACVVEDNQSDIMAIKAKVRAALQKQRLDVSGGCVFYNQKIMETIKRNHKLENLFETSIEHHNFEMYLQPKVEVGSWELKGAEALVRWNHPEEGIIFPSEFIPLFEKDGKIQELDRYMFEETCKFIKERRCNGKKTFPISVNLSRNHFQTPDFLDKFVEIADRYEVPRNLLEFELTERIFVDDYSIENIKAGMHRIHEMGFLCSIDDFGAGYSSLGLLREFEIDVLKLDRSFFMDLSDRKSRKIIKCLIELAKNMDVQTVAEGIETEEQMIELQDLPCNLIQGYIFSKPLPAGDFEKWEGEFAVSVKEWFREHQKN